MSTEEQKQFKDKYKETELKYKRYEVLVRGLGAFAAIASAIAAFLAIRGYTGFQYPHQNHHPIPPSTLWLLRPHLLSLLFQNLHQRLLYQS
jgi:hypothetical protein